MYFGRVASEGPAVTGLSGRIKRIGWCKEESRFVGLKESVGLTQRVGLSDDRKLLAEPVLETSDQVWMTHVLI